MPGIGPKPMSAYGGLSLHKANTIVSATRTATYFSGPICQVGLRRNLTDSLCAGAVPQDPRWKTRLLEFPGRGWPGCL